MLDAVLNLHADRQLGNTISLTDDLETLLPNLALLVGQWGSLSTIDVHALFSDLTKLLTGRKILFARTSLGSSLVNKVHPTQLTFSQQFSYFSSNDNDLLGDILFAELVLEHWARRLLLFFS
ncbi:hypothetical protein VNO78_32810 [Psophocarpus tetragonolobus]|uniref:Uncharacterized protein n=1 Tax=Psophocarpus tetragonolobus TaxID=3891 RepID=A0AAN9P008_PSOTE